MEPNSLCKTLITYGSYSPGGNKHHLLSDLPGEWVKGKLVAESIAVDVIGPSERDIIEAWKIEFSDCHAEMFTPEWDTQRELLYNRWRDLDQRFGTGWGRGSMRWWPKDAEPVVGQNGMIVVNVYLPLKYFPYLKSVEEPLKPFGQEVLDIWVGFISPSRQGSYFEERYDKDDDTPISDFAGDQGELWIDHDFMEVGCAESPSSIADLVNGHSWSDQYGEELAKRVADRKLPQQNCFVLLTAGHVAAPHSVESSDVKLTYMGQFNIRT